MTCYPSKICLNNEYHSCLLFETWLKTLNVENIFVFGKKSGEMSEVFIVEKASLGSIKVLESLISFIKARDSSDLIREKHSYLHFFSTCLSYRTQSENAQSSLYIFTLWKLLVTFACQAGLLLENRFYTCDDLGDLARDIREGEWNFFTRQL